MKLKLLDPDAKKWNSWLQEMPCAHLLQTWEWGAIKLKNGWSPLFLAWLDKEDSPRAMAMVLIRSLPKPINLSGLRIMYVPKGPLLDWQDPILRRQVLEDLSKVARQHKAIFLKIDPDVRLGIGYPGIEDSWEDPSGIEVIADLKRTGWIFSSEQVQFMNTFLLHLKPDTETLLAQMKQKTRYNVRLAARKGIVIREATENDFARLFEIYAETSLRDGFVIRDRAYYLSIWQKFLDAGMLIPLVAAYEGKILAGLMLFHFQKSAWYIFGMSTDEHREKMPNYLLQWEAIQRAKKLGCQVYDLWGAPDSYNSGDSMWGVYKFKEGLGGQVVRHIGAWDLPLRPGWYRIYSRLLPRWLDWIRKKGFLRTRQVLEN